MYESQDYFPGFIKELCYFCYIKNKYHSLKICRSLKKCSYCSKSKAVYVNAKKYDEFVRDFQNNPKPSNTSNMMCNNDMSNFKGVQEKFKHILYCTFAHNDFEYLVWNKMTTIKIFSISEIYKKFYEPYIYYPIIESVSLSQNIIFKSLVNQTPALINPIPVTKPENKILTNDEKRKNYFCWFCLCEITGEGDIKRHIEGKTHKANYQADQKRRWYFKMPTLSTTQCHKNDCTCDAPHSEDECQEMKARIIYRNFMASFTSEIRGNHIYPWSKSMQFSMPKFPMNIKSYKAPVIAFAKLVINRDKCKALQIFLRDDESRPFFKLVKLDENHSLSNKSQLLKIELDSKDKKPDIEFGIEFFPPYSSTYRQRIEFELSLDAGKYSFCKAIRVDVGTEKHINSFKIIWEKYNTVISQKVNYCTYVPFDTNEISRRGVLNENLLGDVLKIITNLNWVNSTVQPYNYFGWMRDMMVFEELEQRLLLSELKYNGSMRVQNYLQLNEYFRPAHDGKLFGIIKYDKTHNYAAREFVMKSVTNCYITFQKPINTIFFESELVDFYRYNQDSRTIDGVCICLSKELVNTVRIKHDDIVQVSISFAYDRLVFDRRHESLNNIPIYDKLSYNPLICPSFTRVPYGVSESEVNFQSSIRLNEQQSKLPKLVLRSLDSDEIPLPFILNGAFGTGKSLVFAETVMTILQNQQGPPHILICTRSYSAAQIYLEIFKERLPKNNMSKVKLLKSDHKEIDRNYAEMTICNKFIDRETFMNYCVFITTLDNAPDSLTPHVGILKEIGFFKYIFVDEASQVLEADALMVYQFGNQSTKFIFAGDIFQTRPNLYNRDLIKFYIPIICRLHNLYKLLPDYKIYLDEVYRTHPKIVEYLKNAIYYTRPLKSSKIPTYPRLRPMKFIDSVPAVEIYDETYFSFESMREVELVIKEVQHYIEQIGMMSNYKMILVCTPFYSQIKLLRQGLRNVRLGEVKVEMPSNIQGGEFDAVFISTVLTENENRPIPIFEPTFHSSRNLINLVVSRSRHLVVVVGNKKSLTGKNTTAPLWREFLRMCEEPP